MSKHILIHSCITAINNTVCVVALVAVYLAKEIEFEERAIYGMASVVVWLAVQRIVLKAFQDHKEGAIMTSPCIGSANWPLYLSLSDFDHFGRGWLRRNDETRE